MAEAIAPGKLILAGEYAVLLGAPAISLAVGTPAMARVNRISGASFLEDVETGNRYSFEWHHDTGLRWTGRDPHDRGRVLVAVLQVLGEEILSSHPFDGLRLCLDTREFQDQSAAGERIKLGLGSSAAIVVALVAALTTALGLKLGRNRLAVLSFAAHRLLQRGRGSGVDVLTSIYGGLLSVEPSDSIPAVETLAWPKDLSLLPVWSGSAASTVGMLRKFLLWVDQADAGSRKKISSLKSAADDAAVAWRTADSPSILATNKEYWRALRQVDQAAKLGIVTPAHEKIAAISESAGAIYKTAGAGGGDLGFALATNSQTADKLAKGLTEAGFLVLDRDLAVAGVELIEN